MNRIRNQLTLVLALFTLGGILLTAFFLLQISLHDKKIYSTELNSVLGPSIADSLGQHIRTLRADLQSFLISPGKIAFSENFRDVQGILLLNPTGKTIRIQTAANARILDSAWVEAQQLIDNRPPVGYPVQFFSVGPLQALYFVLQDHAKAVVFLSEAFAQPSLELSRGFTAALFTNKGNLLFSNNHDPTLSRIPLPDLQVLQSVGVITREVEIDHGQTQLISYTRIPETEADYVVTQAPPVSLFDLARPIVLPTTGVILALLLLSFVAALLFSRTLAKPIEELTKAATKVGAGDWEVLVQSRPRNEIGRLIKAFMKMVKDLQKREKELHLAQQKLIQAESLSAIGRFGAGVAHEVKNPLSAILGYAQILDRKAESLPEAPRPQFKEFLKYIIEETRRASQIITDLLTFARQKEPQFKEVNPALFIQSVERKLRFQVEQAGIQFQCAIQLDESEPPPLGLWDEDQIYQVILNLIQNAIHAFEKSNTKERLISLSIFLKSKDLLSLCVTDNGSGIAPENLTKLFEPFFSTKEVGKGTGLGLAMCHGIVAQHRGTIEVESVLGQGTTFKINLPVRNSHN